MADRGLFDRRYFHGVNPESLLAPLGPEPQARSQPSNGAIQIDEISVTARPVTERLDRAFLPQAMNYNDALIDFLKKAETVDPKNPPLSPYRDPSPGKYPTIGYGHRLPANAPAGIVWDREHAERQLREDADTARDAVRELVRAPLTQSQFNALTSLIFNVGKADFAKSQVLANLNAGDYLGAATEMLTFDHAGRNILPGLTERRRNEAKDFLGPAAHLLPPGRPQSK